jgi:alpha-aminoadipate carrier protein LysW
MEAFLMVNCPSCDASIDVDEEELDEGDSLICEECGSTLNVTGLNPLDLEVAEEEEEEDDEDDDFSDDEDEEEEEEDDSWR